MATNSKDSASMLNNLRLWLPSIGTCLLLQATIAGGAVLLNRCIVPEVPCCDSPLVL